jgi:hypothetical protein
VPSAAFQITLAVSFRLKILELRSAITMVSSPIPRAATLRIALM